MLRSTIRVLPSPGVAPAKHVFSDLIAALAARFDFLEVAVKIFEVIVHLFEVAAAGLLAFDRRPMSGHELLVVGLKQRL